MRWSHWGGVLATGSSLLTLDRELFGQNPPPDGSDRRMSASEGVLRAFLSAFQVNMQAKQRLCGWFDGLSSSGGGGGGLKRGPRCLRIGVKSPATIATDPRQQARHKVGFKPPPGSVSHSSASWPNETPLQLGITGSWTSVLGAMEGVKPRTSVPLHFVYRASS